MASPSKPSDFSSLVLTSSATLCDRFKAVLLTLPSRLYAFVNYVLDSAGMPSKGFTKDLLSNTGIWSVGDVKVSLVTTTPDGWAECEGQALSRTTYSDLYTSISNTYGDGDGENTFNLPDLRGFVLIGRNEVSRQSADFSAMSLGDVIGEETVTLENANYPDVSLETTGYAMAHGVTSNLNIPASGDKERFREQLGAALYHEQDGHRSENTAFDAPGNTLVASTYGETKLTGANGDPFSIMQPSFGVRYLMYTGYYSSA